MDSFIVQTEGRKLWRVFAPNDKLRHPIVDLDMPDRGKNGDVLFLEDVGSLLLDVSLDTGDLLYLPRGHPHATSTHRSMMPKPAKSKSKRQRGVAAARDRMQVSQSLTVSLLTGSVGLTLDKVIRCGVVEFLCLPEETKLHCNSRQVAVTLAQHREDLRRSLFNNKFECTQRSDSAATAGGRVEWLVSTVPAMKWMCRLHGQIMSTFIKVVEMTNAMISEYTEDLTSHLETFTWANAALDESGRNGSVCGSADDTIAKVNTDCRTLLSGKSCAKLDSLVWNLVSQVHHNICNAHQSHLLATGLGLMNSDILLSQQQPQSCNVTGSDDLEGAEVCEEGGYVDINRRQNMVSELYANYRFIPHYCNLI
jgi:hypothetical protein